MSSTPTRRAESAHTACQALRMGRAKYRTNVVKHGIDFETARRIFDGTVLTRSDRRRDHGEERHVSIGQVDAA